MSTNRSGPVLGDDHPKLAVTLALGRWPTFLYLIAARRLPRRRRSGIGEPIELPVVFLENSCSGTPPTAALHRRPAREERGSRFPPSHGPRSAPSVPILSQGPLRPLADGCY